MKTHPHTKSFSWTLPSILMFSGICLGACTHQIRQDTEKTIRIEQKSQPKLQTTASDPIADSAKPTLDETDAADLPDTDLSTSTAETSIPSSSMGVQIQPETADEVAVQSEKTTQSDSKSSRIVADAAELNEIIRLYRRLHTELETERRSALITELLSDRRMRVLELGFELAHRNLSARATLAPSVGDATTLLLSNELPSIRAQAAGLLTRLVTPDAMLLLTDALRNETDPVAAESMLLGVARWPNADATDAVVRWVARADSPLDAATTTAWAFEEAGLITRPDQQSQILSTLRERQDNGLTLAGMKLLARYGNSADLRRLAALMSSDDQALRDRVAGALVETSRATELLVQAAEDDAGLYTPACDSLIRHRATPAGLARLVTLRAPSEDARQEMIDRMGDALPIETLAEGVVLADMEDAAAARLLERLLETQDERSPRILRGIIILAEIELRLDHPSQALDITDSITNESMDPADRSRFLKVHQQAAIDSGVYDHAVLTESSPGIWFDAIERTQDSETKQLLADQIRERFNAKLDDEQRALLAALIAEKQLDATEEVPLVDPANENDTQEVAEQP